MPILHIPQTIDISPEKYITACSDNEVQELSLLLQSGRFDYLFRNSDNSDNSEEFRQIPTENYLADSAQAGSTFSVIAKLFGDHAVEAINICGEIRNKHGITLEEAVLLMKSFAMLEKLRVKHLVKSPQIKLEEHNENL